MQLHGGCLCSPRRAGDVLSAAFRSAFLLFLKQSHSHQAPAWHAAAPREGKASLDGAAMRGPACGTSKPSSGDTPGRGAQPLRGTNTRNQPWVKSPAAMGLARLRAPRRA